MYLTRKWLPEVVDQDLHVLGGGQASSAPTEDSHDACFVGTVAKVSFQELSR